MAAADTPAAQASPQADPAASRRVLVAEDSAISRRMLEATLAKQGYDVISVADGGEASRILNSPDGPRLALIDWMMPGMTGVEVCRQLRTRGDDDYVYIVLLTSRGEQEDIVQGMESGADDYVTKPYDMHELVMRLKAGQRIVDLQARLSSVQQALREQATHDALTGLLNRRAIMDILEREVARASRLGSRLAVLMIDLDHFKRINDTLGHPVGDALLKESAARMESSIRAYDRVGRYGGEEFLVVLPNISRADASQVAERLRARIAGSTVPTHRGPVDVTASVGICVAQGVANLDVDTILREADDALYQAKESGRNRVCVWGGTDAAAEADNTCSLTPAAS